MSTAAALGSWAETVAVALWPELKLTRSAGPADLMGTDAIDQLTGRRVQIKCDQWAAKSKRFCFEIFKRTGEWASYGTHSDWRVSPSHADEYVFVTIGYAVRVPFPVLVRLSVGRKLEEPRTTTACFFLPVQLVVQQAGVVGRRHKIPSPDQMAA